MSQIVRNQSVAYEIITLIISALIGYITITKVIGLSEKHGA